MGVDFRDEGELVRAARARGAAIRASGAPTSLQPLLVMEVRRRAQPARREAREPSLRERLTGAFHREPSAETDALARAVRAAPAARSAELFDAALRICAGVEPAQDMLCARVARVVRRVFADGAELEARCRAAAAAALAAEPLDLELARGAFAWDGGAARAWWDARGAWRAAELLALAPHAARVRASDAPLRRPLTGASTRERLLVKNTLDAWPRARRRGRKK